MSILIGEAHYLEVYEYYQLLMRCTSQSAKRGGYSNLWLAITPLVNWIQMYKAGQATWADWYQVTHAASLMFDEWLSWWERNPLHPRDEYLGLNEFQFKTLLLAIDNGRLAWSDVLGGSVNDAA